MGSPNRSFGTVLAGVAVAFGGFLAPSPSPVAAQMGPDLRSAGMAGAYMGLARGHQALYWNPANLALEDRPGWSIGLPSIGITAAVAGPPVRDLALLFDDDITDADRADLMAEVPTLGLHLRGDAQVPIFGLSIGTFAFTVSGIGQFDAALGRPLVDLLLYTRQYGDIDHTRLAEYRVGHTAFRSSQSLAFAAGYGRMIESTPVGPVSVGATGRYVHGLGLQRGRVFEPIVNLATSDFALPILALRSTSGSGFGLDVGVTAQPLDRLTVGFAVENLVQRMDWDESLELIDGTFSGSDLADLEATDFLDGLDRRPFDPTSAPTRAYTLANQIFRDAYAPRVFRVGGSYALRGGTRVGTTLSSTQGPGELKAGWPSYVSVGVEQRLPILATLRAGAARSSSGATALSAGLSLGIGPIGLDVAAGLLGAGPEPAVTDTEGFRYPNRLESGEGLTLGVGLTMGR